MTTGEQNTLFDGWLAQHAAVLHHVANGFADGADRHDLMQELLLALWRAAPAFRGGAQPPISSAKYGRQGRLPLRRKSQFDS